MDLDFINEYVESYGETFISNQMFLDEEYRKNYNRFIREEVENEKIGCYIWINQRTDEILYVGMAGKVHQDGNFGNHSIQQRLMASRGRDDNGKDIMTNSYVRSFMQDFGVETLLIKVLYTEEGIPPTYIESLILNQYLIENRCLPRLNNAF
jgi:hypothetical protein